jgi:hypothetical protein
MQDLVTLPLKSSDLPGRMLEVTKHLVTNGLLQSADLQLMSAWISDLKAVGYQFPKLVKSADAFVVPRTVLSDTPKAFEKATSQKGMTDQDTGSLSAAMWLDRKEGSLEHSFAFPQRWCMRLDTQLVVNMNTMGSHTTQQLPLLHALYRPWFRRVFFAGPASAASLEANPNDQRKASSSGNAKPWMQQLLEQGYYIDCSNHTLGSYVPGGHTYACAAAGVLTSQQGVWRPDTQRQTFNMLHSNDDVAFSPCMMADFSRQKFWAAHDSTRVVNVQHDDWEWWQYDLVGRGNISVTTRAALANAWGLLAARIKHHGLLPDYLFVAYEADLYYVPARYQTSFVHLTEHFQSFYAFSEVAVPAVMGLLKDTPADVEFISFVRAFDQVNNGRQCIHSNITKVLPLGENASMAMARACVIYPPWRHMNATHAATKSIFGIHPIKLSIPEVVQHWMSWWLSQACP